MEHLTNSDELEISLSSSCGPRNLLNLQALELGTRKLISTKDSLPIIEIGKSNVNLIFTFKKGEELNFTDPGVISLLMDRDYFELLANSRPIIGEEKERIFTEDFQNAFMASDGIFGENSHIYHYYKINEDIKAKDSFELPTYHLKPFLYDEQGYLRYVFIETFSSMDFSRSLEQCILSFATEIPYEDAVKLHEKRLIEKKIKDDELIENYRKEREEEEKLLSTLYEEKKNEPSIFPGTNGQFIQNAPINRNLLNKVSLEKIKDFFKCLTTLDADIIKSMYFYGGTIPYILTNAESSREFGDVDIFVPISQMKKVREELMKQSSFKINFDSKSLTERCNLTSNIKATEISENDGLNLLSVLMCDDSIVDEDELTLLEKYFTSRHSNNHVLQDFGFKGSLFGVNISVFPMYQYGKDILAKSFNVTDVYEYLLAVKVMNNTEISDFIRNVKIFDTDIKILPLEYTLLSKRSAISSGYIKREERDSIDIQYIEEHNDELKIDDEYLEYLRKNYPDYAIALAYYLNGNYVETISGEHYKSLMLKNNGRYVS